MTQRPLPLVCTLRRAILLTASLLALTLPRPASAATITVNTFAQGSVAGCSFAEAIDSINAGADGVAGCVATGPAYGTNDTIILPFGTYNFTVADNGVNGLPIILTSVTINGNGSTLARTGAPAFRFFQVTGVGLTTLNSLTLTGGNPGAATLGGAVLDSSTGTLTVTGSTFSGNTAQQGGAIHKTGIGGDLTVTSSTFTNNTATSSTLDEDVDDAEGGAIFKSGTGNVTVTSSTFTNNTATGSGGADASGGAIEAEDGDLTITNTTFSGNTAQDGGAISKSGNGNVTVTSSTFTNNRATSSGSGVDGDGAIGGAIKVEISGTLSVTSSIFVNNRAVGNGGSGAVGGGLALEDEFTGSGVVNNNCFVGNTAQSGGGVFKAAAPDVNAQSNWWGAANGPSGVGPGSGDAVSANVDFTLFLTSPPFPGCDIPPIPTLAEWAQLGMIALLIVGGLLALRRRSGQALRRRRIFLFTAP